MDTAEQKEKPEEITGEQLYQRFIAGDEEALEDLVGLYRGGLTLFINGFVRDIDTAEELMIDVFAELIAGGSKFAGRSSLKTYLFGIGRNLALQHFRKNRKYRLSFSVAPEMSDKDGDDREISPETVYLKEEEARNIYDNMMTLKEEYAQALYLIYFEDMSYAEAGKVLKKRENQIAGLAHRAKAALKIKLEKEGITYP